MSEDVIMNLDPKNNVEVDSCRGTKLSAAESFRKNIVSISRLPSKIHRQLSAKSSYGLSSKSPAYPLSTMEKENIRERYYISHYKQCKRIVNGKQKLYTMEAFLSVFSSKVSLPHISIYVRIDMSSEVLQLLALIKILFHS